MSNARRSERLRRKRQTTPISTRPSNYTLFGSGYVVESEASFLPIEEIHPSKDSRHVRYKDSPHSFIDQSPIDQSPVVQSPAPPKSPPRNPRTPQRIADRVRVSLFDILGSAAKKPANASWRTAKQHQPEDQVIDDVDDSDQQPHDHPDDGIHPDEQAIQVRKRPTSAVIANYATQLPNKLRRTVYPFLKIQPRSRPIALISLLFATGMLLLLYLEARHSQRINIKPAYIRLRQSCTPQWTSDIQLPPLPTAMASLFADAILTIAKRIKSFVFILPRLLFRPAIPPPATPIVGDFVTRAQLETEIIPRILSEAKKTASLDAARLTSDLPQAVRQEAARMRDEFAGFAERYAADKDQPPDFALASAGGKISWTRPSMYRQYAHFAKLYAEAIFGHGRSTPLPPVRPSAILDPNILPGQCWSFLGDKAEIMIQLSSLVKVTSVTLEHTPRGSVYTVQSAPRFLKVYGIKMDKEVVDAGEFLFDMKDEKKGHLQRFLVPGGNIFRAIRLDILSNHGANYTSVYRFRVHGERVQWKGN